MTKIVFSVVLILMFGMIGAQNHDSIYSENAGMVDKMLASDSRLTIGGYGEAHYNQPLSDNMRSNGKLDVHRMVMLFAYNFSNKTQFVTELEYEHVVELYVEQFFLQHRINSFMNLRAGLLLAPMGIVNIYHEPTTFNGVERPIADNIIAPTTWRELGFGVTGNLLPASLKYEAYLMNGFNGYDGGGKFSGSNGLRKGRQKGAESYISAPNFAAKVEYYGIRGLNLGLSGYFGDSQSTLYNGVDKSDNALMATADSSVVGIAMIGLDGRYSLSGMQLRGQFYYTGLSNVDQYNNFTGNDLGTAMLGYYVEAGYDLLRHKQSTMQLVPFVRYSFLNTHQAVAPEQTANAAYQKDIITSGLTFKPTQGAVIKADVQLIKSGDGDDFAKTFNVGIGVAF